MLSLSSLYKTVVSVIYELLKIKYEERCSVFSFCQEQIVDFGNTYLIASNFREDLQCYLEIKELYISPGCFVSNEEMTVFCHATYTVKNPSVFFIICFKRSIEMSGFLSPSDQLKTLHECLLASAHICIFKKRHAKRYSGKKKQLTTLSTF